MYLECNVTLVKRNILVHVVGALNQPRWPSTKIYIFCYIVSGEGFEDPIVV